MAHPLQSAGNIISISQSLPNSTATLCENPSSLSYFPLHNSFEKLTDVIQKPIYDFNSTSTAEVFKTLPLTVTDW
jgi:hypothetical protein